MKRIFLFLFVFLLGVVFAISVGDRFRYHSHIYTYKVKKGDTLYKIAKKFEVSWKEILKSNGIANERSLKVNQRLIIKKRFPSEFLANTSWYGKKFHGRKTANGETYNMYGISAAHKTLPLGTAVLVKNPQNGRRLKLRINDRGPYIKGRHLDLSFGAAKFLGIVEQGVAPLIVKIIHL